MHLLNDKKLIAARVKEKRQLVLAWLKTEGFSTAEIIGKVLQLKYRANRLTLQRMAEEGLIEEHKIEGLGGTLKVWGVTPHGAIVGADLQSDAPDFGYFEPGRLSANTIQHALAVQEVRLDLQRRGWTGWKTDRQCHQLKPADGWLKVPDSIATDPHGQLVAIEVERTFKTVKRYQAVISSYLQMINGQKVHRVQYFCPKPGMAERLRAIFQSIRTIPVRGQSTSLTPAHLQRFSFTDLTRKEQ